VTRLGSRNGPNEQQGRTTRLVGSGGDIVKYVLAVALVAAGVFAFYWFSDWARSLRALAVAGGLVPAPWSPDHRQGRPDSRIPFGIPLRAAQGGLADPPGSPAHHLVVMIAVAILSLILAGFDVSSRPRSSSCWNAKEMSVSEGSNNKRWYVVHAYSGFEKSVAQALRDRIVATRCRTASATSWFRPKKSSKCAPARSAVPSASSSRATSWSRSPRTTKPVSRASTTRSWHLIKETPKVMGFIGGTADRPLPIKDSEADAILQRVQEGVEKPSRRSCSSRARWSRHRRPFVDFNGVVERSTTRRAACAWPC
jgi:transcriptional antiterminator NusG